jgi:hypothetical protein
LAAVNGTELHVVCLQLPKTGRACGLALSFNRGIKVLRAQGLLASLGENSKSISYSGMSQGQRKMLLVAFKDPAPGLFDAVRSGIIKPFLDASQTPAARRRTSSAGTLSGSGTAKGTTADAEADLEDGGGKMVDRVALLSCAIADPSLAPFWGGSSHRSPRPNALRFWTGKTHAPLFNLYLLFCIN